VQCKLSSAKFAHPYRYLIRMCAVTDGMVVLMGIWVRQSQSPAMLTRPVAELRQVCRCSGSASKTSSVPE
jgi:hypothetical protein